MARYKIDCCTPDCPNRHGECHGTCEKYKTQRAELDATNEEIIKQKEIKRNLDGFVASGIDRYRKRIHNKNRFGGEG